MKRQTVLLAGLLVLAALPAAAQFLSVSVSADGYRGDLNRTASVNGVNISGGYTHYIEETLFLRVQAGAGSFASEFKLGNGTVYPDPIPPGFEPTLYFENRHVNADVSVLFEALTLDPVTLYAGIGAGVMQFRLYDRRGRRLELQGSTRIAGEEVNGLAITAPLSVGLLLFKGSKAQVALEQQWLLTNSDYLDNIGYAGRLGDDLLMRTSLIVRLGF